MDYLGLDIDIDETKGTVSVTNAGVGEYTIKVVLNSDYVWVQESSNSPFNFGNKRFRSFRTKLKQADQETKDRYKEFINYSKTIPNVKNSISKKQVRLYKGRKTVAIVFFRGKTKCMAFPLDPKIYENTKYKGIDASSVKRFENTPMLIKLTSNRRLETAKYLLLQSI